MIEANSTESLRILRVASDIYPDIMGGIGIHVHEMSKVQAQLGHDVTVLTSDHGDRDRPVYEEKDGYKIIRHREYAAPLDNSIIPGLFRTLKSKVHRYDVIHAHSHLFFSTNIVALFSQFNGTPIALTNHGLMSQTAPEWIQQMYIPTVGRFTMNSVDKVLCYTETDRNRLRQRRISTPINVIPNGINCDQFSPSMDRLDKKQILFVGRLKPGKGAKYLIDAFVKLHKYHPNYDLLLVGEGPLKNELKSYASNLDINDCIKFVGQVPNDKIVSYYQESDVFVLPSLSEGLPRTVLESMACETPVIVTDLEQLVDIIDGCGLTVSPESPEDIFRQLKKLLENDQLRTDMGIKARKKVLEGFSWEQTVQKTTQNLLELAKEQQ